MISSQDTQRVLQKLRRDMPSRAAYTSDASIFRRVPAAILEPETVDDIRDGLALARENGWSIVARGGGSSVAGNAIGEGLIIDTSRHFNKILEIDPEARSARVQPGVVCDELRSAAAEFGLTYGPDPSTHSRCTVGGMVANNACGSHSVAYGTAADNLVDLTLMLYDGRSVKITANSIDDSAILDEVCGLYAKNQEVINSELGRFPRQVSGFGLHYLGHDLAKAFAGSEGTLGVITELTVRLVERPKHVALAVLSFADVFTAADAAHKLRQPGVATIEGMGGDLLDSLRTRPGQANAGENLPGAPNAGGWLYCETAGDTPEQAATIAHALPELVDATDVVVVTDSQDMRELWRIREASAGTVTRLPDGGEAWPNWEDSAVPPENLASYLRDLYALMDKYHYRGIPFGHFGEGCVHVRISFDFATEAGIKSFHGFMNEAAKLVSSYGGSLSGEHGDGRARSSLLREMYSPAMRDIFEQFKLIFDPQRMFNPGVLVWADGVTDGLRMDPAQRTNLIDPVHAFSHDKGSFLNAVNRCVGVSACRSMEGSMCPSFQITHDEVHSTRGRARVLSEMFRGETVNGEDVESALDLCLSCKACASECPVNVDMATYKAEFLNDHYKGKLRPRAHYLMGWLPLLSHLAHKLPVIPRIVNWALHAPVISTLMAVTGGLDTSRPLISFAPESLQKWDAKRNSSCKEGQERIVLWPDSFNSKLETSPAKAAVRVLEKLGYEVIIPHEFVCCGLTWHSTGQLSMTQKVLKHTAEVMQPYVDQGLTVVGLEPSCTVMLQSEAVELSDDPGARALAKQTKSFAAVVAPKLKALVASNQLDPSSGSVLTQVHCHEKSLGQPQESSEILEALGFTEEQIQTGCCGMAGNWGFEKGHGEMSMELGERELFPRVREHDGPVLADGFSCRTQVGQGTDSHAVHLAEIIDKMLE